MKSASIAHWAHILVSQGLLAALLALTQARTRVCHQVPALRVHQERSCHLLVQPLHRNAPRAHWGTPIGLNSVCHARKAPIPRLAHQSAQSANSMQTLMLAALRAPAKQDLLERILLAKCVQREASRQPQVMQRAVCVMKTLTPQ